MKQLDCDAIYILRNNDAIDNTTALVNSIYIFFNLPFLARVSKVSHRQIDIHAFFGFQSYSYTFRIYAYIFLLKTSKERLVVS